MSIVCRDYFDLVHRIVSAAVVVPHLQAASALVPMWMSTACRLLRNRTVTYRLAAVSALHMLR